MNVIIVEIGFISRLNNCCSAV